MESSTESPLNKSQAGDIICGTQPDFLSYGPGVLEWQSSRERAAHGVRGAPSLQNLREGPSHKVPVIKKYISIVPCWPLDD